MQSKIDTVAGARSCQSRRIRSGTAIGDPRSGLKLGYRKGARGGVWIGKLVSDGARVQAALGAADDGSGKGLNYIDAAAAATAWAAGERRRLTGGQRTGRSSVERERIAAIQLRR